MLMFLFYQIQLYLLFDAFSKISLFFTNIPLFAHTPSLTTIASGVAKPKLQGHATTNTVINVLKAVPKSYPKNQIYKKSYYCNCNNTRHKIS